MREFINKHKLLTDIVILVLICVLMLVALEIRQPYFFLQDDNADSYICQYVHSLRSVREGEFPFYNFHQLGGVPFLDRGQTGELNVVVYLGGILSQLFLGHLCGTVDFTAALYLIAGAVGMFMFLRKKTGIADYISILGAIAWSFNSFSIYCGSNWIISIILTGCFPWMMLSTAYLSENDGLKAILIAAIPKVFMFYSGHPQYFAYAIIFDYLFGISYLFFNWGKKGKLKAEGLFTLKYFLSGLVVTLWSLPLFGPMYEAMSNSGDRSAELPLEIFVNNTYNPLDLIRGLLFPFIQYDVTTMEIIDGEEVGVMDQIDAIHKNMSHIGIILVLAALFGLTHLVGAMKRIKTKEEKTLFNKMYSLLPPCIIAMVWATAKWFNRIIYLIPMINRFRYPFKLMQYSLFFLIAFACMSIEMIMMDSKFKDRKKKMIGIGLIAAECINLMAVYMVIPVRFFGIYTNSPIPYVEKFEEDFRGSRVVPVLAHPFFWDPFNNNEYNLPTRTAQPDAATMRSNYATYYGIDSVSGYDFLTSDETWIATSFMSYLVSDVGGNIGDIDDNLVQGLRRHAVSYYVTIPYYADYVESKLAPYGITRFGEDSDHVVFYDDQAEPRAYCGDDLGDVILDEHVNYLKVTTPDDFEGGSVTVNFTHDRRFVATLDGEEVAITDSGDFHDMIVEGVPAGSHVVIYRYVDNTFRNCLIISGIGTVILAAALFITSKKRSKTS